MKNMLLLVLSFCLSLPAYAFNSHIKVDQFGYLPTGQKVAVISNPKKGFNAGDTFVPADTYQIRRSSDNATVFSGPTTIWNDGAVHADSGDQVWWFDFTGLQTPGDYYVYDTKNKASSAVFSINDYVYWSVLRQAVRTFFYQRVNQAKAPPYADMYWSDGASHGGVEQDRACMKINPNNPNKGNASTTLDLSGGWYDAGDFNKYINFADGAVHDLLFAYEENPSIWLDNYDIPESWNGVPDLLDEIKYELDWMLKMQLADGSVLHKVSSISWDIPTPPSTDKVVRRYAPATASATISAAGAFAHAAQIYKDAPSLSLHNYSNTLKAAAIKAWNWLEANPGKIPSSYNNGGFNSSDAEDSSIHQKLNMIASAMYLYILTGDSRYQDYIDKHAKAEIPLLKTGELYFDGWGAEIQNAMLYYSAYVPNNPLSTSIREAYKTALFSKQEFAPARLFLEQTDAYRAHLYYHSWGSNRAKSQAGSTLMGMVTANIAAPEEQIYYRYAASGYLHYLHGVNPLSVVFLSNMLRYGAELSVPEFYHLWFRDASLWDNATSSFGPPPGYLVGGVNMTYNRNSVYIDSVKTSSHLIRNQPTLKKYKSGNSVKEYSYELTENSITYQAAYIRLLSKFIPAGRKPPGTPITSMNVEGTKVSVSWSSSDADGYTLYYSPYPAGTPLGSLDMGKQTSFSINLWAGAAFYVILQAHNSAGNSGYSPPLFFEMM